MLTRHTKVPNGCFYIFTHIIAAFFAGALLKTVTPKDLSHIITQNTIIGLPIVDELFIRGIIVEGIANFFIVLTYYLLIHEKDATKYVYGPGIGGIYAACGILLFHITGSAINPAKVLAFGILSNRYWILAYIPG